MFELLPLLGEVVVLYTVSRSLGGGGERGGGGGRRKGREGRGREEGGGGREGGEGREKKSEGEGKRRGGGREGGGMEKREGWRRGREGGREKKREGGREKGGKRGRGIITILRKQKSAYFVRQERSNHSKVLGVEGIPIQHNTQYKIRHTDTVI